MDTSPLQRSCGRCLGGGQRRGREDGEGGGEEADYVYRAGSVHNGPLWQQPVVLSASLAGRVPQDSPRQRSQIQEKGKFWGSGLRSCAGWSSLRGQGPGKREGHRRGVPFLARLVGGRWIDSQRPVHRCLDRVLQFPVPSPQSSPRAPSAQCPVPTRGRFRRHPPYFPTLSVCVSWFAAAWHAAALCAGIVD
jgi:hypothetical protein